MKTSLAALLLAAAPMVLAQERAIVKTATVKAPPAEVWKAWTTTEGITSFFAPEARIEARPGGAFHVHFNPYAKPGLKGADDMQVLDVRRDDPQELLRTGDHLHDHPLIDRFVEQQLAHGIVLAAPPGLVELDRVETSSGITRNPKFEVVWTLDLPLKH